MFIDSVRAKEKLESAGVVQVYIFITLEAKHREGLGKRASRPSQFGHGKGGS